MVFDYHERGVISARKVACDPFRWVEKPFLICRSSDENFGSLFRKPMVRLRSECHLSNYILNNNRHIML